MLYKFKAIKTNGESYEGTEEAKNEAELYSILKSRGEALVSAKVKDKGKGADILGYLSGLISSVKEQEKVAFAHNLGSMIEAGLPVARGLSVIERQTKNKKFKDIVTSLNEDLKKGSALSVGLAKFPQVFPPVFVSMVHAGEESGNLSSSLQTIAGQLDKADKLKKKIRGALMYPSIIIIAMIIVGILMLIFIVPTLTTTFQELNVELPVSTQIIIFVSNFLKDNIIISLIAMGTAVVGLGYIKRTPKGKRAFDWAFLRIPLIKTLVQETNSARATRTLSSLLTAGVEVVKALEITAEVVQNIYFKEVLVIAQEKIQKGSTLSSVFREHEDLYPPLVNEMMAVGEETGKLPDLLIRVADYYEEEVDQKTKNMSTIIEPFLMILIGTVVGFFAISMITPMYSLTDSI